MSDESETILRLTRKFDEAETPVESRQLMSLDDYASESKRFTVTAIDPGGNSRVLQLASIARYRAKRRTAIAEKAVRKRAIGTGSPGHKQLAWEEIAESS